MSTTGQEISWLRVCFHVVHLNLSAIHQKISSSSFKSLIMAHGLTKSQSSTVFCLFAAEHQQPFACCAALGLT
jgi:hypothetical protein